MKKKTTFAFFSKTAAFVLAQIATLKANLLHPFRTTSLLVFALVFSANLLAQNVRIKGRILSEKGEPLVGATVQLRHTTQGTISDMQGFFSFDVVEKMLEQANYEIEVSFVGYQKIVQKIEPEKLKEKDYSLELILKEGVTLREITVNAYREYPVTLTEVSRQELEKRNLGQDIPILLNFTPSVVTTSDAGAGIGYTGMRIRGSDATRTNVTLNGIPLNDAESQGVFWVNMPDFVSSAAHIQIQRGVGTSVNGAGAFGATVNIDTEIPNENPYAEVANSFGSFQTRKHTLRLGTGKIGKNFAFNGRLSRIKSDGFIDKAFSDLSSYFVSGLYQNQKGTQIRANIFGGREVTFQAWNGVPEEILRAGNRTYNELAGYDNEIDNYEQQHYQLILDQKISPQFFFNTAFHYTKGRGYFEQFREKDKFSRYHMPNLTIGDSLITESDLIRRRWLDNDFYGLVFNLNYQSKAAKNYSPKLHLIWGGGWNRYQGKHFGEVIWAEFSPESDIRHRYYDNDATKTDANLYFKTNYQILTDLFLFVDLQLRNIDYTFLGFDNDLRNVTQNVNLTFFNPKFGATYDWKKNRFYASFARAHREPNRNDFTESSPESRPQAERLDNVEVGWQRNFGKLSLAVNYFLMQYKDQLVLTGQVNDVGAYTRQNVKSSYRTGIEIVSTYTISKQFSWQANLTWSRNKIRNFVEFLDDYDNGGQLSIPLGDTDIAFSPTWVGASQLSYAPLKGLQINWLAKYVGEQYLDNTSSDSRKIEAFLTNDLQMSYQFSVGSLKNIELNFMLNNLFNVEYENNGYTFGYFSEGAVVRQNYFYPQAGRNFLLGLRLSF
jgi:iron complex outermembrane receptor protein